MRYLFLSFLLLCSVLDAKEVTGEGVYKTKCASCHLLYISPSKLIENFMEKNNTILNLKAPTINQIVFRLKSRVGDPKGDEDMHKMEIDSFLEDYLMKPDKSKTICLPKVIKHFETMPSMKGKLNSDEMEAIADFLYAYNPDDYVSKKLEFVKFNEAMEEAKKENKVILLKLTREHCFYCKKMDREVFREAEVINAINKDFMLVEIDIGKEELPLNLKKGMTPTFVFVNKDKKIMATIPGSWSKKDFLEILSEAVKIKGEK